MFRPSFCARCVPSSSTPAAAAAAAVSSSLPTQQQQPTHKISLVRGATAPGGKTVEPAKHMEAFQVRRCVPPLQQRFSNGAIGNPEVDSTGRPHPIDFNVIRKGTTLRIKWKIVGIKNNNSTDNSSDEQTSNRTEDHNIVTTTVTAELMRVFAPSTDVLSLPQNIVVSGKRGLTFSDMHLVGNYAVRVTFSDGHNAGIFGYHYLYDLCGPEKWLRSRHYIKTLRGCRRTRNPPPEKKRGGSGATTKV